jgi:hypothetical protein
MTAKEKQVLTHLPETATFTTIIIPSKKAVLEKGDAA